MKILVLGLLALCACAPGTEVSSANYDQSCKADIDCAPVYQGDTCVCGCPNTAVNNSQVTRYQADTQSARARCGPLPAIACAACSPRRGLCTGNKCSSRPE